MSYLDPRIVAWRRTLRSDGRVELGRTWRRRTPPVVVDGDGVRIRSGSVRVPWSEVRGVTVTEVPRAPDVVELEVSEDVREQWLAGQGQLVTLLWVLDRIWRPGVTRLRLPGVPARDGPALDAWLSAEAERRRDR